MDPETYHKEFIPMKNIYFLLSAIVVMSCSAVKVLDTDKVPGFAITNYKTFDFYKIEGKGDTSVFFSKNVELVKAEIEKQLAPKGLTRSESDPDLLINIGVVVVEKIQTRETTLRDAQYLGQRNYHWQSQEIEVGRYKEGTATVHLVDPKTKSLLWKGAVEGILPNQDSKRPAMIVEGIQKLFAEL
jgi:hypothetical protein